MLKVIKMETNYRRLFLAGIINGIGDRFSQVALLTLILQMTGSGMSVGITMALRMIPFLIFSPISYYLAEKFGRKRILILTDFTRAALALSFLFINSPSDMWIVYSASFLLASGEAIYGPIRKTMIPDVVKQQNLKQVNAWEQVMVGFVLVIGAMIGGLVSFIYGPKAAFLINVFSFLGAGWILSTLTTTESKQPVIHDMMKSKVSYKNLLPVIGGSSFLLMLILFELFIPLINGIENVLISVYAVKTFGKEDFGVGVFYSVLGLGLIGSPMFTNLIKKRLLLFAFLCVVGEGIFLISISKTTSFSLAVIFFGITAIFSGAGNTLLDTVAMETIPHKWQGVYFGFVAAISNTFIGISMFLTGIAIEGFSPRYVGFFGGCMYLLTGGIFLVWSFRFKLPVERRKLLRKTS